MLLPQEQPRHLSCITHEGKVVVLSTTSDGKVYYIVRQDGFEDSYLNESTLV